MGIKQAAGHWPVHAKAKHVRVAIRATDPISHVGLVTTLQAAPGMDTVTGDADDQADVVVMAANEFDGTVVSLLRRTVAETGSPTVLVVNEMREADVLLAVECRVVAVLPRHAATGERVVHAVTAAANGGGTLPPELLGTLLRHVRELQRDVKSPLGAGGSGLSAREADVLRLIADGVDTAEIADKLSYSERTVKNILYGITSRLNLRNRPHAVAYAIRAGII